MKSSSPSIGLIDIDLFLMVVIAPKAYWLFETILRIITELCHCITEEAMRGDHVFGLSKKKIYQMVWVKMKEWAG